MKNLWFRVLLVLCLALMSKDGHAKQYVFAAIQGNPYQKAMARLLGDAFAEMGHELIVRFLPGRRALLLSNLGKLDGEVGRIAKTSDQYPNLVRVPVAIGHFKATAVTYLPPTRFYDFEQFRDHKLGILRGIVWSEKRTQGFDRMVLDGYGNMMKMLKVSRFDYGFGDQTIFEHIKSLTEEPFHILQPPIFDYELFPFIHQKNQDLIAPLTQILEKMNENNVLQDRMQEYFRQELKVFLKL